MVIDVLGGWSKELDLTMKKFFGVKAKKIHMHLE